MSDDTPSTVYWREIRIAGVVGALLVAHFALANAAAWNKCAMFDEGTHIASGFAARRTGDFRILPLAISQQLWMTWPLEWMRARAPSTDQPLWRQADNWGYGRQLLFEVGNDPMQVVHRCRMMNSLGSVVLGLLVFLWSRKLFGAAGGFVALVLYAFNPTVLAHAAAATPDTFGALAFTAAAYSLQLVLERVTLVRLLCSSLVWGLALTAKFSTVLLLPIAALMLLIRIAAPASLRVQLIPTWFGGKESIVTPRLRRLPHFLMIAVVHAVGAWAVIWAMFDFTFDTFREFPNDERRIYLGRFTEIAAQTGRFEPVLRRAHAMRMLPEAYLYCFAETVRTTGGRVAFLDGWFGTRGFPSFFPLSFLYKTPPAFFFVLALGLAAHVSLRRSQMQSGSRPRQLLWVGFYATYPLWYILVVYGYTSITGPLNIGIRHILPMFAPLFIICGVAGNWFNVLATRASQLLRAAQVGTVVCLTLYIGDTAAAFPNYLAYFNLPSGGLDEGHQHLVDSSLDWGQELPALKDWLDEQGILSGPTRPRLYLSYFGTTPPRSVGFDPTLLPCYFRREMLDPTLRQPFEPRLAPGVYCISATMLQTLYVSPFEGPWQRSYEERYRELLPHAADLERTAYDQKARAELLNKPNPQWWVRFTDDFEQARLARLCAYLRHRRPLHIVNGALLVYRLSAAELDEALRFEVSTAPNRAGPDAPLAYD
ncbi:MAG: hypothetical protein C0483_23390 [Pirellula sp.]|nr:hypothetical protein [Pirellula sp.]